MRFVWSTCFITSSHRHLLFACAAADTSISVSATAATDNLRLRTALHRERESVRRTNRTGGRGGRDSPLSLCLSSPSTVLVAAVWASAMTLATVIAARNASNSASKGVDTIPPASSTLSINMQSDEDFKSAALLS